MDNIFNNKINILKALAIMIVVAGHLEFSIIPMFPPYSFQVVLFFFIAGMLYKEKYSFIEFFKRRLKTLLLPYFLYVLVYIGITAAISPLTGKFWGVPVNWYNELIIPFLTGHQLDLISPLWFVPQLFTTLIIYKVCSYIPGNSILKTFIYTVFALAAIQMGEFAGNLCVLYLLRTLFSLLFVHLGHMYMTKINGKYSLFTGRIFFIVMCLQSVLWFSNADYTPADGIGLSYILVWGEFDNWLVPIITSLTGIWMSLFIVDIFYDKVKNWTFLQQIGQNTYHIMANHLLVFNFITYLLLAVKGISFDIKNNADIYWFFCPLKTTYFYFVIGLIVTTYLGIFLKNIKRRIFYKVCVNIEQRQKTNT